MAQVMRDHAPVWDRLVARPGCTLSLRRDCLVLAVPRLYNWLRPHHSIVSTIKVRSHGFHACMDTEAMFDSIFDRLQDERFLPRA